MKTHRLFALAMASVVLSWTGIVCFGDGMDYVGAGKCTATAVDPCTTCTLYYDAAAGKCYGQSSTGTQSTTIKVCEGPATDTFVCMLSGTTTPFTCSQAVTQWNCTIMGSACLPAAGQNCQCPTGGGTSVGSTVDERATCSAN